MILSDRDIAHRLDVGDLEIDPLDDPERQIQPASVDLRLGRTFLEFERPDIACIQPSVERDVAEYVTETTVDAGDQFIVHPGDFVLATTQERVSIPHDLLGHVEGRSSLGRLAIVIHATAGLVDPGYTGQITLELSNLGAAPVALTPGMRISQLTLTELRTPAERPYGAGRDSKYQGQAGPQASRIQDDPEFAGDQGGTDGADADASGRDQSDTAADESADAASARRDDATSDSAAPADGRDTYRMEIAIRQATDDYHP